MSLNIKFTRLALYLSLPKVLLSKEFALAGRHHRDYLVSIHFSKCYPLRQGLVDSQSRELPKKFNSQDIPCLLLVEIDRTDLVERIFEGFKDARRVANKWLSGCHKRLIHDLKGQINLCFVYRQGRGNTPNR